MTKKKSSSIKAYAFIDTNIFLDFYRSQNETTLSLLKKLEGVKERIICTYQVEMEFLKSRQNAIIDNSTESSLSIDARLPAVMGDSQLNSILKKEKKEIEKRKKELQKRIVNIIKNPSAYDPVYKSLESIFSSENSHVLTRDMNIRHKIKRLAWRRFILGYPPRKGKDTTIGDALNWEWFIHCCSELKGKFIIVSRDADYGAIYNGQTFLNDALKSEFRDRVGKKSIIYTTKLSEALKLLEVSVTQSEEESEADQLRAMPRVTNSLSSILATTEKFKKFWDDLNRSQDILKNFQSPTMEKFNKFFEQQKSFEDKLQLFNTSNVNAIRKITEQQEVFEKFLKSLDGKDS